MLELDDLYRKFGDVAEGAQLLETERGTLIINHECIAADLVENPNRDHATEIYDRINKKTLGQLIKALDKTTIPSRILNILSMRHYMNAIG